MNITLQCSHSPYSPLPLSPLSPPSLPLSPSSFLTSQAKQMFMNDAQSLVESPQLFQDTAGLRHALVIHPVQYPKYMYRLHSFFKEMDYNATISQGKSLLRAIKETSDF